jgi:hypothetical protein
VCRPKALSAWIAELESVFPHLSRPQIKVLAQYSLGMVMAGRCGLSCVAYALAQWLGQSFDAVRERLRDWYCGASDKSGHKRRELAVESCFAPLLTWVVLPATAKGAWKPQWLGLLQRFKQVVPPHLRVIVLADRGLYAKWLFKAIIALGWHPFLRRFVLTDLAAQEADCAWYGLRSWVERGFKHAKSGGWNWRETRMNDPRRASRQWLAMAVASMLVVRQGAAQELEERCTDAQPPPPVVPAQKELPEPCENAVSKESSPTPSTLMPSTTRRKPRRILSVFRAGLLLVQSAIAANLPLSYNHLAPESWPSSGRLAAANQPP